MSPELQWRAVMARDRRFDGAFVYAVRSTRIYCRPSCPSRRPAARQVMYFARPADAERGGFRACRRCHPRDARLRDAEMSSVLRVCQAIEKAANGITLSSLARIAGMSPSQLRRSFDRVVGTSPKGYAEAFRMNRMKQMLQDGESITGALYGAGYSSPSRVYGDSARRLGMTPGEYRARGAAVSIRYGTVKTSIGWLLVAATDVGVCAVKLGDSAGALARDLKVEFDAAQVEENTEAVSDYLERLREHVDNHRPTPELPLDVQATAFQARVWEILRKIPYGETRSYTDVAREVGNPSAVRAVARACATNPAALLIPCHRVVRENGELGGYRWGLERKAELLKREEAGGTGPGKA